MNTVETIEHFKKNPKTSLTPAISCGVNGAAAYASLESDGEFLFANLLTEKASVGTQADHDGFYSRILDAAIKDCEIGCAEVAEALGLKLMAGWTPA